jgi:prephenate dehydrogenase
VSQLLPRLAVIGLGLIGGSAARAFRSGGAVSTITGYDADDHQIRLACELGVIDAGAASAAEAVRDADVVLIAVPVLATANALRACAPGLSADTIVTDVGSTKQSALAAAAEVFGEVPARFVPAHPIAGTEKSGVAHSLADLFHGHRVIVTPHSRQDTAALACVEGLWKATGARLVRMDAARHDAIFAATSHLPHLLAYSFVDMLTRLENANTDIFPNAGGGFRDFTRIASSSPRVWHDIVRANAQPVADLLRRQIGELQDLLAMIESGRWQEVQTIFERAREARERHLARIE